MSVRPLLPEQHTASANLPSAAAPTSHTSAAGAVVAGGAGLVGQVTSHTLTVFPTVQLCQARAIMGRERRLRRMRKCVIAHADSVRETPGFRIQGIMVTLTYRDDVEWNRKQVTSYINSVREWLRRRRVELRYQWVIELTQRGRPHYHVLFWVPHGMKLPKPDESGQWSLGSSRIELARRPVGYLVKYATKGVDGDLPRGARLFGAGGCPAARFRAHRAGLPAWLDKAATPGSRCFRWPFLGWVEKDTGTIHQSPYELIFGRDPSGLVTLEVRHRGPSCS